MLKIFFTINFCGLMRLKGIKENSQLTERHRHVKVLFNVFRMVLFTLYGTSPPRNIKVPSKYFLSREKFFRHVRSVNALRNI